MYYDYYIFNYQSIICIFMDFKRDQNNVKISVGLNTIILDSILGKVTSKKTKVVNLCELCRVTAYYLENNNKYIVTQMCQLAYF